MCWKTLSSTNTVNDLNLTIELGANATSVHDQNQLFHLFGMCASCSLECFLLSGSNDIFMGPWGNCDNGQVLGKPAITFVFLSLWNGKAQYLSVVLDRTVREARPSHSAALKLFWLWKFEETTREALWEAGSPGPCAFNGVWFSCSENT